jgi:hypothetical protein
VLRTIGTLATRADIQASRIALVNGNQVQSPNQAIERVLEHLENDVGIFLKMIEEARATSARAAYAPYWALMRMMFPVAESLADLIFQTPNQTAANLIQVLEVKFEKVRAGYQGKAATLTQLFRHSLTHSDEPRTLVATSKGVAWRVTYNERSSHLAVEHLRADLVQISFDVTAFYDDLVAVCKKAIHEETDPKIVTQYNSWLRKKLDEKKRPEKRAIDEIEAL